MKLNLYKRFPVSKPVGNTRSPFSWNAYWTTPKSMIETTDSLNIVCVGNSLTLGTYENPGGKSYPTLLGEALAAAGYSDVTITNRGINSYTIGQMITEGPTIDGLKVAGKKNILLVWEFIGGYNITDLATAWADLQSYCTSRKSTWDKVICFNAIAIKRNKWNGSEYPANTYDGVTRDTNSFNNLIRANWQSFCDGMVELRGEPLLNNEFSSAYTVNDQIHLVEVGYTLVKNHIYNLLTLSAVVDDFSPTVVKIRFQGDLDSNYVPAASAFSIAGKTITGVAVKKNQVELTVSEPFNTGDEISVTYTKPDLNFLRSTARNRIQTFTASVTNNVSDTVALQFVLTGAATKTIKLTGANGAAACVINWGDGNTTNLTMDGTLKSLSRAYAGAGTFNVTITKGNNLLKFDAEDTYDSTKLTGSVDQFFKCKRLKELWIVNTATTWTGSFNNLPASLTKIVAYNFGTNVSAQMASMPAGLTFVSITAGGANFFGSPIWGEGMTVCKFGTVGSGSNIYGYLKDLPSTCVTIYFEKIGNGLDISTGALKAWATTAITLTSAYTTAQVDGFFNAYAPAAGNGVATLNLKGTGAGIANQADSAASADAQTTLIGKGKTCQTN